MVRDGVMKRLGNAIAAAVFGICAWSLSAAAQPTLAVQGLSIAAGSSADLRLFISDPETTYVGVNVKFTLPAGLTVHGAAPGNGLARGAVSDVHTRTQGGRTVVTAIAYSIFDPIVDASGLLLRLQLTASPDPADLGLTVGGKRDEVVDIQVSGLSAAGTELSIPHLAVDGYLELRTGPFGDVDGNGSVNAVDIQRVINASLGIGTPQEIAAADINEDGVVDATDIQLAILAALGTYVPQGGGKQQPPVAPPGDESEDDAARPIFAEVLPAPRPGEPAIAIQADSYLYIRLRAPRPIDAGSVRGTVSFGGAVSRNVGWLPLSETDGWAVFWEGAPWQAGEDVTMTAEAADASGAPVGPYTYTFRVAPGEPSASPVWQPGYGDFDATALAGSYEGNDFVSLFEGGGAPLPELAGGAGLVFEVAPEQLFDLPQRVWLPVPADSEASGLEPYLYLEGRETSGWHRGASVAGWLGSGDLMELELNGLQYVGLVVHHGGIVRLGPAGE